MVIKELSEAKVDHHLSIVQLLLKVGVVMVIVMVVMVMKECRCELINNWTIDRC